MPLAFGTILGGMTTLIGTPPNALLAAFLADNYDVQIGFGQWMLLGVPVAVMMLAFIALVEFEFVATSHPTAVRAPEPATLTDASAVFDKASTQASLPLQNKVATARA